MSKGRPAISSLKGLTLSHLTDADRDGATDDRTLTLDGSYFLRFDDAITADLPISAMAAQAGLGYRLSW